MTVAAPAGTGTRPTVAIGIPTFRRPQELERLLAALQDVVEVALRSGLPSRIDVLVVDNDPQETGRDVALASPLVAGYTVEEVPGVAAVRNRILDESRRHDVLVFVDDDETPADAEWLVRMLQAYGDSAAQAVAGPVVTLSDGLDPWVAAGGFFARGHRAGLRTGDRIDRAATNNLLLDRAFVSASGIRFDERFGRSGGEDSLFTSQLHRAGARLVWCAEALVRDHLPAERLSRRHALRRTRGMAAAGVRVGVALEDTPTGRGVVRGRAIVSGCARMATGSARVVAGAVARSQPLDAVGRKDIARAIGAWQGVFGRVSRDYGQGQ